MHTIEIARVMASLVKGPTIVTRITLILLSGTGKFNYSLRATDLWITKIFCTVLQSFIYNTNG